MENAKGKYTIVLKKYFGEDLVTDEGIIDNYADAIGNRTGEVITQLSICASSSENIRKRIEESVREKHGKLPIEDTTVISLNVDPEWDESGRWFLYIIDPWEVVEIIPKSNDTAIWRLWDGTTINAVYKWKDNTRRFCDIDNVSVKLTEKVRTPLRNEYLKLVRAEEDIFNIIDDLQMISTQGY